MHNKKGWLRILDAFIAITLIISFLIVTVYQDKPRNELDKEIIKLQGDILNSITNDYSIRNQILNNNTSGVNARIEMILPTGFNYSSRICAIEDVCGLTFYLDKEIFSEEYIVSTNLTSYSGAPVKIKLFFWRL